VFTYVRLDSLVPKGHPAAGDPSDHRRRIGVAVGQFGALYAEVGRPSTAPKRLLCALLPQAFYTIRSELVRRRYGRSKKRGEHNNQHAKRRLRSHRHPKPPAR
jgi:hypothetical protein